jgi:ferritin-like metal-binding protein YciE
MKVPTLDKLLEDLLKDLYSAENQLIKALPKMTKAVTSDELREAMTAHLEETKGQVERLDQIGEELELRLSGKKCVAMEGLIEEGSEALDMDGPGSIIDLAIIGAAQKVEHYEISAYGTARTLAEQLGYSKVAKLLQATLNEESATDEKLTTIASDDVFPSAHSEAEGEDDEEEEDEEEKPTRRRKTASR